MCLPGTLLPGRGTSIYSWAPALIRTGTARGASGQLPQADLAAPNQRDSPRPPPHFQVRGRHPRRDQEPWGWGLERLAGRTLKPAASLRARGKAAWPGGSALPRRHGHDLHHGLVQALAHVNQGGPTLPHLAQEEPWKEKQVPITEGGPPGVPSCCSAKKRKARPEGRKGNSLPPSQPRKGHVSCRGEHHPKGPPLHCEELLTQGVRFRGDLKTAFLGHICINHPANPQGTLHLSTHNPHQHSF